MQERDSVLTDAGEYTAFDMFTKKGRLFADYKRIARARTKLETKPRLILAGCLA
jgi:hypothetical protein